MIETKDEWNDVFKELKNKILKEKEIVRVRELALDLHRFVHAASVSSSGTKTLEDELWENSSPGALRRFSDNKIYSAAWHLWHGARIEDITVSHMLLLENEIFYDMDYRKKLGVLFNHTGNSMTLDDMKGFNGNINLEQLRNYRHAVGERTRAVLGKITTDELKSQVPSLEKIEAIGSVAGEDSWLLDYWRGKNIAGIVTMPLTRHLLVHLNSAFGMM